MPGLTQSRRDRQLVRRKADVPDPALVEHALDFGAPVCATRTISSGATRPRRRARTSTSPSSSDLRRLVERRRYGIARSRSLSRYRRDSWPFSARSSWRRTRFSAPAAPRPARCPRAFPRASGSPSIARSTASRRRRTSRATLAARCAAARRRPTRQSTTRCACRLRRRATSCWRASRWRVATPSLALEYFLAAPDVDAVHAAAQALAPRDPAAAYALERMLRRALYRCDDPSRRGGGDVLAHGRARQRARLARVPGSPAQRAWLRRGMHGLSRRRSSLAPLSEKYAIVRRESSRCCSATRRRAAELFARAVEIDPASADAIAGLGVVAYGTATPAGARAISRARGASIRTRVMVRALERDLR